MKRNYTLKTVLMFVFTTLLSLQIYAQIRVVRVDPAINEVTIRNFGSTSNPQNISSFWLCNFPSYSQLSGMTVISGSLNLAIGAEVTVTSSINFPVADSELGLYNTNSFSSSSAMEDYLQWGSAGHQRESVAQAAGIWTAGTFINFPAPFEYTGNGSQNGLAFWQTSLSLEGFEKENSIKLFPNPTTDELTVQLTNSLQKSKLVIFDITGKTVIEKSLNNTLNTLDVSGLLAGLYIIKVESNKGAQTSRFIKK